MSDKNHDPNQMTGAAMIVRALVDQWRPSTSSAIPAARCFRSMIDKRAHDHGCAGHLVRIVVLVGSWLAPDALPARLFQLSFLEK